MKWIAGYYFLFTLFFQQLHINGTNRNIDFRSILDEFYDEIRAFLKNIYIEKFSFDTGKQEFGCLQGSIANITITGLDSFTNVTFDISIIPLGVKNLIVELPCININGKYEVDGNLDFPLGKNPLHMFGDGVMNIDIGNCKVFANATLKSKEGVKRIRDLDFTVNIETTKVKLDNLMNGGSVAEVLNKIISETGPTVFDYYKEQLIQEVKKPLINEINKILRLWQ